MRRFLASKEYTSVNWPPEFAEEYLPLLQHCTYHKGSLMQNVLETELSSEQFIPLPPVQEVPLELRPYLSGQLGCDSEAFSLLTLCRQSKTLAVGGFVLGAKGSRHSRSSLVLAERSDSESGTQLADIVYFVECICRIDGSTELSRMWFAYVNWLLEHQCKLWYGNPVQVWTTVQSPSSFFIPVKNIKSRLVYVCMTLDVTLYPQRRTVTPVYSLCMSRTLAVGLSMPM